MFMDASEHLLLMDLIKVNQQLMSEEDLKPLFDAGIHTAQLCWTYWNKVEKVEGVYDWSEIDQRVNTLNQIGFKVLLMCYTEPAQYFSDDYYSKSEQGLLRGVLSPWNKNAQASSLNFYRLMRDRYNSPMCLTINGNLVMGETCYCNEPAWFDASAIQSFHDRWRTEDMPIPNEDRTEQWMKETLVNLMLSQNSILAENPSHEIWSMLHPEIALQAGLYGNGCKFIDDIYTAYEEQIPGVNINQIWYTMIQHERQYPEYKRLINKYHMKAYGGAEYAEGIKDTSQTAIQLGFKGLVISPLHPFTNHLSVEQWMIDNIHNGLATMKDL